MALGKRRRERQLEAFAVASDLPKSPGHPFYTAPSRLLAANGFDALVEKLCALLRRNNGAAGRPAGRLLPDAVRRLLRGAAVPSGDRLVVQRQTLARLLPGPQPDRSGAESLLREQNAQASAEGDLRRGLQLHLLWRCETNMAARNRERHEATPDGGRGAEPLGDHAGDHRDRRSEEPPGPPLAHAGCQDPLRPAHVGAGSPGGGAGLVGVAWLARTQWMTVSQSETQNTTWDTAC